MPYLKLTNVNFYHGGSKTPRRIRHNQNYRLWQVNENEAKEWLEDGGKYLISRISSITNGRVIPTSMTTVQVTEYDNYAWNHKVLRRRAMKWWWHLSDEKKTSFTNFFYSGRVEISLTGREIEGIYCREIIYKQRVPFL
jgi:hypothetical protein